MKILFLCVANSARSQMAEGLAKSVFGYRYEIYSAGSKPSGVNPYAVRVLAEEGIDASHQFSKGLTEVPEEVHLVVTLCAEEVCPVFLKARQKLHWPLPDPACEGDSESDALAKFRSTRDELKKRLTELKAELEA